MTNEVMRYLEMMNVIFYSLSEVGL
jgi:hypothetical protein